MAHAHRAIQVTPTHVDIHSGRLIGNWPDVPSLHIYECLRDPHVRGVATLHYTWNGRQRRLVSV